MKELIERLESFDAHKQPMCTVHLDAAKAIKDLQAKLEAANQLAQINGEIAANLKADLNEYAQAADKMAAEHKVEREILTRAIEGCVEHLEYSTPQGGDAYVAAKRAIKKA